MATPQTPVPALEIRRLLDAPRERVYRAWTELEQIRRWWGPGGFSLPNAEQDFRQGGRYRFHMLGPDGITRILVGEYREIVPPERLVFTWAWENEPAMGETVVTVQLHARGGKTELVLTHRGFPTQAYYDNHNMGWSSMLDRLPGAA